MTSAQIKIGGTYLAKVSDRIVPVRVLSTFTYTIGRGSNTSYRDGWICENTLTGRKIRVRSAQKFRAPATV